MPSSPSTLYRALRPLLFRLDAERAHRLALAAVRGLSAAPPLLRFTGSAGAPDARLAQQLLGRGVPSPLGLAAGLDKDAVGIPFWFACGFGFVEVGTVTRRPQAGNPRPRLFRHPGLESLQNALGFNNAGLEALRRRLRDHPFERPVLVNLGKGRDTPLERAADDYLALVEGLEDRCDAFVVNLSSPNTPGLRELERSGAVGRLTGQLVRATRRPLLVKLSPDQPTADAVAAAREVLAAGASGIVLTNTTTDYSLIPGARSVGGLSGRVLAERSYALLRAVAAEVPPSTLLVSVGGVDSAAEVWRRLAAGARLVELYTALVYHGPSLIRRLEEDLLRRMEREGVEHLDQLVGRDLGR
ncbi:MAG: quinone-dependent dihydroorotate dehydrogenase [Thermoanaerobaculia bacterium]